MLVQTIGLYPLNNIDVSIIHHQDDRKAAAHIASALQRSGVSVWVPPKSLVEGWIEVKEVFELANSSRILIYLISPSAFEQHWVSCETNAAFEVDKRRTSLTILPVAIKKSKDLRDI